MRPPTTTTQNKDRRHQSKAAKPQPRAANDLSRSDELITAIAVMTKLVAPGTRVAKSDVLRLLDSIRSNRVKSTRAQSGVTIRCERDGIEINLVVPYAAIQGLLQAARTNDVATEAQRCCERVNQGMISHKFSRLLEKSISIRIHTSGVPPTSTKPDVLVQGNQVTFA